jgi:SNF2 family DNA or RNA helicase
MRELMPHQKLAFEYAKSKTRLALFMEMRLGKTVVAIRWAEFKRCGRVLVVAPLPVLRVWKEELLEEEFAEEDVHIVRGSEEKRIKEASAPGRWFLINYEGILSMPEILGAGWDCVILDESTRIRNPKAQVTKLLNSSCRVPHRAILSGLPAPESVMDYFEQMRFLHGRFLNLGNYWEFRARYFHQVGYEWICTKTTKDRIKEAIASSAFMLTRKDAGFKDKKVYEKRFVPTNAEQKKLMKQVNNGFNFKKTDGSWELTKWVPVKYQWLSQIAGGFSPEGNQISNAKNEEVLNLLKGELKGESVVVWFRFDQELQGTARFLRKKGFKVGTFFGGNKEDALKFERGDVQVLCAQGKCGAFGLDWSISSTVIYYSNWYDGEIRQQTEDRIVDVKKNNVRLFIDLISESSIDEDVVDILRQKKFKAKEFFKKLREKWSKRTT